MEVKTIILLVIIIVLLIIVIRYIYKDVSTLTGLTSAKTMQQIESKDLSSSNLGNTSNFSYSIWFFIDDWNYRYGESKVIFGRMTSGSGEKEPCPSVTLAPAQNNIIVSLAVYPGLDEEPKDGTNFIVHTCGISNVPIQKWCNLMLSVYGRTLDLYLDGKLVRTCVLPGVAKIDTSSPVYITPMGGFSGWTTRFQYWPESSNPQKAWDVYKSGYGSSLLGSLFGRYTVKLSLMEGDSETSSLAI